MTFSNQGVLSGTPTVAGSFSLTTTVTDSSTPAKSTSSNFTLSVANTPLVFTSSTVPTAVVGRPYIQALPVAGGTQPYNPQSPAGRCHQDCCLATRSAERTPSGTAKLYVHRDGHGLLHTYENGDANLDHGVNTLVITTTVLPNGSWECPTTRRSTTGGGTLAAFVLVDDSRVPTGTIDTAATAQFVERRARGTPTLAERTRSPSLWSIAPTRSKPRTELRRHDRTRGKCRTCECHVCQPTAEFGGRADPQRRPRRRASH